MKIKAAAGFIILLLCLACLIAGQAVSQQENSKRETVTQTPPDQVPPQEVQKPRLDYMSTFLSRTTSPLGIKEDEELRRLLKQPKTHWALRAGIRHILN